MVSVWGVAGLPLDSVHFNYWSFTGWLKVSWKHCWKMVNEGKDFEERVMFEFTWFLLLRWVRLLSFALLRGRYKTWALDSGLNSGLDYGLTYGPNFGIDFRLESRIYELTSSFQVFPASTFWLLTALCQKLWLYRFLWIQHIRICQHLRSKQHVGR